MTDTLPTIAEIRDALTYAEYIETPPSSEGDWIDVEAAEMAPCPICGSGRGYIGFKSPTSYRAFSVCDNGHAEEF